MVRRALIIGSAGNIGQPLVAYLRACGYETLECDIKPGWRDGYIVADINQPIDLLPAFDWQPSVVFLLAAMVSRVTCERASGLAVTTNLAGINNVLQLCKRAGAMTVFFSTSEVYGPDVLHADEAMSDPQPNNRYGLTKLLGERLVEYEVRTGGLKAVTLRPFMIYDEHEDLGDHRSAMIRFAYDLGRRRPIDVHRGSERGWLHVSDAVRAIEAAARVRDYTVINIGHSDIVPMMTLAGMIADGLEAPRDLIRERELPTQMTLIKRPVLTRMRTLLNAEPRVDLAEGVTRVCGRIRQLLASPEAGSLAGHPTAAEGAVTMAGGVPPR